jgi:tRNA-dihydrouridine synthase
MDCKTVDGMDCKTVDGSQRTYLKICAPMVRYSQLPFRELVRSYGTDLCYTPMILANVFKHSKISQQLEFRTSYADSPVIVQFAASNALDAADAAELVAVFDINPETLFRRRYQLWLPSKVGYQ